ncbi:hypothetical protein PT2222_40072 [Paraburkholderia tropica]
MHSTRIFFDDGLCAPDRGAFERLVEAVEQGVVLADLVGARGDHGQRERLEAHARRGAGIVRVVRARHVDHEAFLAARHRQIDFGEQFRVEQCAVQRAVRVADAEAVAQRIERIAFAREDLLGLHQRVDHLAAMLLERRLADHRKLGIEKADVERRVVNDQFRAANEVENLVRDFGEFRLVGEEFGGQAVHRERAGVAVAFRVDVEVQVVAREPAVHELDAADFDDAVARAGVQAGGFGIENDLAHGV